VWFFRCRYHKKNGIYGYRLSRCGLGMTTRAGAHVLWITDDARPHFERGLVTCASGASCWAGNSDGQLNRWDITTELTSTGQANNKFVFRKGTSFLHVMYFSSNAVADECSLNDTHHALIFEQIADAGLWNTCVDTPWQPESRYVFSAGSSNIGALRNVTCGYGFCGTVEPITCQSNGAWTWASGCTPCSPWGPEPYLNATLAVASLYTVWWDFWTPGLTAYILDGGVDTYVSGAKIKIAGCQVASPYPNRWQPKSTWGCTGATTDQTYYLRRHDNAMFVYAKLGAAQTWRVDGTFTLGTGYTPKVLATYQLNGLTGLRASYCGNPTRAGIHHVGHSLICSFFFF
jgi:hypothetical protein